MSGLVEGIKEFFYRRERAKQIKAFQIEDTPYNHQLIQQDLGLRLYGCPEEKTITISPRLKLLSRSNNSKERAIKEMIKYAVKMNYKFVFWERERSLEDDLDDDLGAELSSDSGIFHARFYRGIKVS